MSTEELKNLFSCIESGDFALEKKDFSSPWILEHKSNLCAPREIPDEMARNLLYFNCVIESHMTTGLERVLLLI